MAKIEPFFKALETAQWELSEAFKGLPDEDAWKRAHPRLLSVGELAGHIAYWEAVTFLGSFDSPLASERFSYYTTAVEDPVALPLSGQSIAAEVGRIHEACKASFLALDPDSETPNPYREGWTWGFAVEYQGFHVAYHTGQIYSVRHLLGHETVDN